MDGQNLLENGDFEDKRACPIDFNFQNLTQIEKWKQVGRATPDYFHKCSKKAGVPVNLFGDVDAQSGDAYAGFVTYSHSQKNYREYLQTKLTRPLSKGEEVCVEFYISTAAKSLFVCDGVGVLLTKNKVSTTKFGPVKGIPQVENLSYNILNAYGSWVKISDTFIAQGGEQFVTVGNFRQDNELTVLRRSSEDGALAANPWSYLYIDNIVIKKVNQRSDCSCVNDIIAKTIHNPPLELKEIDHLNIKSIHFEFDEYSLTDSAKIALDETLKLLHTNKNIFIQIAGHTDNIGNDGYNDELSLARTQEVIRYFEEKGIDSSRVHQDFFGSKKPVSPNDTATGRSQNRRVEFNIVVNKYELIN